MDLTVSPARRTHPRSGPTQCYGGCCCIAVVILLLVIAGVAYVVINRERARVPQASVRVRVLSPKPAAVYRWFSGRGTVTDHEARTLGFDSAGTLAELLPPGTPFAAGDVLGRLRAAQPLEALLSRQRARLAFYEQNQDKLKVATISDVVPSVETISTGKYPVSRPLYFYVKKAHVGVAPGLKEFGDFFLSEQMIGPEGPLAQYGLVPAPDAEREAYRADFDAGKTM